MNWVIKIGGSLIQHHERLLNILSDCKEIIDNGYELVLVHGGGNEISRYLDKLNITSYFIDGHRVTDDKSIEIVEMVLSGKINKSIVRELFMLNQLAVGISGKDGGLVKARRLMGKEDMGLVGEIEEVSTSFIESLQKMKMVPVISPMAISKEGETLNVNADLMAMGIAESLECNIVFLTDVDGVYKDENNPNLIYNRLHKHDAEILIDKGIICGGMIPKLRGAYRCLENGGKNVLLLNGSLQNALKRSILSGEELGTQLTLL